MPGALFVVATPIGNLEDLTFRALRVLKEVDVIAAEDTRRTSKLLAHYAVSRPLISLHEHNEHRDAPRLVERIQAGQSVALVSDAGTPTISDPGSLLVRLCRAASVPVVPVPGPSAITAALSVTGLPAVPFTFAGFPPASGRAREQWLEAVNKAPGVVVLFEAPHRVRRTLHDLLCYANRPIFVHREITKIHESFVEWDNSAEAEADQAERGEHVIVLGPAKPRDAEEISADMLLALVDCLESLAWMAPDQVLSAVSAVTGLSAARVRSRIKKARISVKQQNQSP